MHTVGTWGCALYHGDDSGDEGKASALRISKTLKNAALRQIIRTTIGAGRLTLTLSNEYGQTNMTVRDVQIARATVPGCSDIDASTSTPVTFGGKRSNLFPSGAKVTSDPVDFEVKPLERIAVTICFEGVPELVSCHVGARANSFVRADGEAVPRSFGEKQGEAEVNTHWFALSGLDVQVPNECKSIVVLGDSITDGFGVVNEQYTRWSDVLAERLQENPKTRHLSVINMGIGTNKLLGQKNPPAAFERFERDVLSQPGIGYFVFLIGVNDLAESKAPITEQMIDAYEQMIVSARGRGIKTIGCTIMPYSHEDIRRHEINNWLRDSGGGGAQLDSLIDFDALVKDSQNPDRMQPHYDCDGIHPTAAAYKAMGEAAYDAIYKSLT